MICLLIITSSHQSSQDLDRVTLASINSFLLFLSIIISFYTLSCDRKQKIVLNGQYSSWNDVRAAFSQGSMLGPLLFLIYINELPDGLKSEYKLFADETALFSVVNDINTSPSDLNEGLQKIGN